MTRSRGNPSGVAQSAALTESMLRRIAELERASGHLTPHPVIPLPYSRFTVDASQELNPATPALLTLTADESQGVGFTLSPSTTITVAFDGVMRVSFGIIIQTASSTIFTIAARLNGTNVPGLVARAETLSTQGDFLIAASMPLLVADTDTIDLQVTRTTGTGSVLSIAESAVAVEEMPGTPGPG